MANLVDRPVPTITEDMIDQYKAEGYFMLEDAIGPDDLDRLRGGAQFAMDRLDKQMEEANVDRIGINAKGKRYFTAGVHHDRPELAEFAKGAVMSEICRAALGPEAYLFWDQYVIKAGDPDTSFAWHQDSGYVHEDHSPYLTCWIPLDDVTEENGSVYILPYGRSGIRSYIKHIPSETGDKVCYFGSDPGMPVVAKAGSILCFSSTVIHRSGPNLTDRLRRVYLLQYSSEVIMDKAGTKPWGSFEPVLQDSAVVSRADD